MSERITSLANPLVKQAVKLHLKKHRDDSGLFLVEGQPMIDQALQHGWEAVHIFDKARNTTTEVLQKISKKDNPQDVIAIFKQRRSTALPDTLGNILPALEEIRDPGNLGTILRSCHALGLTHLVLVGACCDVYAPETIRASMGSFAAVTVIHTTPDQLITWKTKTGVRFLATDVLQAADYRRADYTNAVLLLGNEQKGLSGGLKKICDAHVKIPMPGSTESLNVAMAATLLLFEAQRSTL